MGEMTSGTGEVYKDPDPDEPEPEMVTGDGVILSGPNKGTQTEGAQDEGAQDDAESAPSGGLDDMTKEELYELATQQDIEGRSSMNKEELLDALKANQ